MEKYIKEHMLLRQTKINKCSGRQWCGTATAEWDSFQNHLKVVRISWNSEPVYLGLKWSNMFICVTFWQL